MNSLFCFVLTLLILTWLPEAQAQIRDPFWPIGKNPTQPTPAPTPEFDPTDPEAEDSASEPRELDDEELRERTQVLADQISKSFTRRATMVTNGKIYAHVGKKNIVSKNPWVTEGDHFIIELLGNRYRMEVVKLTRNHIELEPHRVTSSP
jgi:hypothetical protein